MLALTCLSFAHQTGGAADPADVVVVKFGWKNYTLREGWDRESYRNPIESAKEDKLQIGNRPQRPLGDKRPNVDNVPERLPEVRRDPPARQVKEFQYRVTVKNAGAKTIKSVAWDYLFVDAEGDKEIARHSFVSNKKIKPGEKKELVDFSTTPPTPVVNAASGKSESGFDERVVINRIEYADGSSWQRAARPKGH